MPASRKSPNANPDALRRRTARSRTPVLAAIVLSVLGTAALFVTFVLPDLLTPASTSQAVATAPQVAAPVAAPAPTQPADADKPEAANPEAGRLLAEALRRLARLENEGARIWGLDNVGGVTLADIDATLNKAGAQGAAAAVPLLQQAIADLDRLAESKPERQRLSLAGGRTAYDRGDAATAQRQFEIAAAISPGDTQAAALVERARKLPEVLENFRAGSTDEAAGNLRQAREAYQRAVALDAAFGPARDRLKHVDSQLAAADYRSAVSEALARLGDGNLRAAEAALARAQRLNPNAPELADIRQRLQASGQAASLDRLRLQADGLARQEKWSEALAVYDQALAIDRNAAFASSGKSKAQSLAQLHAALDSYIAAPARLQSTDPLAHAKSLLAQSDQSDEGQILSAKKKQLAQLITAAQMPIPVTLRSDQNTEVELYRIGKLGSFDSRRIELPPGRYTAVGSRAGYRDVRVQFDISPNQADQAILIQCTEQIR